MNDAPETRARIDAIIAAFQDAGAVPVDLDLMLPAGALLDLYGEDIRARAYTTHDPDLGEMMLRPDFTVPIVERHMAHGHAPARYTYQGDVFRVPAAGSGRPRQYRQVGYELFGGDDPAADDAEVFALFSRVLAPYDMRPVTGDMGLLLAAIESLETSDRRRMALKRHLWRPRRFRTLFDRFAGRSAPPAPRQDMVARAREAGAAAMVAEAGPQIGLRQAAAVEARLTRLAAETDAAPIPDAQAAVIDAILDLNEALPKAQAQLQDMAADLAGIGAAVAGLKRRMAALEQVGIDPGLLSFEGSFGRSTMEYYDGFVFEFTANDRPDLPPVASGGRYDALTRVLGQGRGVPAIGGVIRPALLGGAP